MSGGLIQKSRGEAKPFLFVLAAVAALGGFLFGYDTGVISGALLFIKPAFHASTFQQQSIIGSLLVGAVVGAGASGATELIAARFLLGLSVGTASFVAPMYIAEVAPRQIRGGLVSFNQMMVVLGILIAYIVDFVFKGVADNWRWMLGLGAVPGVALAVGMVLMPHSPRWLMERGRDDEARAVLKRVHGRTEGIEEEMDDIHTRRRQPARTDAELPGDRQRRLLPPGRGSPLLQRLHGHWQQPQRTQPHVLQLIMDSLRYWVLEMHVDGVGRRPVPRRGARACLSDQPRGGLERRVPACGRVPPLGHRRGLRRAYGQPWQARRWHPPASPATAARRPLGGSRRGSASA
jgi:hypothetical protein